MMNEDQQDSEEFVAYPAGYIFGIIDDRDDAERLMTELTAAGVERSAVLRFTGGEGARRIDASGTEHGILARVIRFLEYADDSRIQAEEYARQARSGHCVIGVHAPTHDERERARGLLKSRGGHFINYYSSGGFTEVLDP